jgi:hypothetical protein
MPQLVRPIELAPADRLVLERLAGRLLLADEAVEFVIHKIESERNGDITASRWAACDGILELARGKRPAGASVRELIEGCDVK